MPLSTTTVSSISAAMAAANGPDELLTGTRPGADRRLVDAMFKVHPNDEQTAAGVRRVDIRTGECEYTRDSAPNLASPSEVLPWGARIVRLSDGTYQACVGGVCFAPLAPHWRDCADPRNQTSIWTSRESLVAHFKSAPPPPGYVAPKTYEEAAAEEVTDKFIDDPKPFVGMYADDHKLADAEVRPEKYDGVPADVATVPTKIRTRLELSARLAEIARLYTWEMNQAFLACEGEARTRWDGHVITADHAICDHIMQLSAAVAYTDGIPCPRCGTHMPHKGDSAPAGLPPNGDAGHCCEACCYALWDDGSKVNTPREQREANRRRAEAAAESRERGVGAVGANLDKMG